MVTQYNKVGYIEVGNKLSSVVVDVVSNELLYIRGTYLVRYDKDLDSEILDEQQAREKYPEYFV